MHASGLPSPHFASPGRAATRSDGELMRAIRRDDRAALGSLMERHWSPLLGHVLRQVEGPDEAEDVVQEVFVRVWERREQWRPGGSVQAYLYRIARNLLVDRSRRAEVRERHTASIRLLARRVSTPAEEAALTDLREAFEDALSTLPERRREAFLLIRFQGLTLKEAAEVMDLRPRTVANHVYLAATDLEEALRPFLS